MLIEQRDHTLTYTRAIRENKSLLILDWLLEFRFSSYELLTRRIGSTPANSYEFFRSLRQQGLIHEFRNVYTNHGRFFMLTRGGVSALEIADRDVSRALTQVYRLHRYSHIMHDLAVQAAVLKRIQNYEEVIWDKHIQIPDRFEKPDALMRSPKGYWVAFEYERSRKESKRIYLSFMNHAQALIKRHFSGVYYLFDRESDLSYYQAIFAADEWPEYHYNRKSGKMTFSGNNFKPDSVKNLRNCFLFVHEPANSR